MCEGNEYINMIMSKTIYKFDYKQNCFDILRLVENSVDIDTMLDWKFCEMLLSEKKLVI